MTEPASDFMHPDRDRVISFRRDDEGRIGFDLLNRIEPLEFEGFQPAYWRKVFRSEAYASEDAAFAAARERFPWVEAGWREALRI